MHYTVSFTLVSFCVCSYFLLFLSVKLVLVCPSVRLFVPCAFHLSVCLSACLSVRPSVCCLSLRVPVRLSVWFSLCPSVCLSVYMSVCLPVFLSVQLSVCHGNAFQFILANQLVSWLL